MLEKSKRREKPYHLKALTDYFKLQYNTVKKLTARMLDLTFLLFSYI